MRDAKGKSGLTLFEVVTSLIVIGFLTGILMIQYLSALKTVKQQGFENAYVKAVGHFQLSFSKYYLKHGHLPGSDVHNGLPLLHVDMLGNNPVPLGGYYDVYYSPKGDDVGIIITLKGSKENGKTGSIPWPE